MTKKTSSYGKKKNGYRKKTMSKSKSNKAFVKKVKTIIKADIEDKQAYNNQFSQIQSYNSAINSSGDCAILVPNIANGTADNARIGDQIRGKALKVQGHLITRFTGSTGTTYYQNCRIGVRLFIVQPKSFLSQGGITSNATTWQATLLKKGGTTSGFTGLISDLYSPVNTDAITVYYDKVFYVQNPYSNAVFGSTMSNLLMPNETCRFFGKTIKLRNKVLKYDANIDSGLTPTQFNPVMIMGYAYLDGSSPDTVTTNLAMSYVSTLNYEDA